MSGGRIVTSTPSGAKASTTTLPQPVMETQPRPWNTMSAQASSQPAPSSSKRCGTQGGRDSKRSLDSGGVSFPPANFAHCSCAFSIFVLCSFTRSDVNTVNWNGLPSSMSIRQRAPNNKAFPSIMCSVTRRAALVCGRISFKSSNVRRSARLPGTRSPGVSTSFARPCWYLTTRGLMVVPGSALTMKPLAACAGSCPGPLRFCRAKRLSSEDLPALAAPTTMKVVGASLLSSRVATALMYFPLWHETGNTSVSLTRVRPASCASRATQPRSRARFTSTGRRSILLATTRTRTPFFPFSCLARYRSILDEGPKSNTSTTASTQPSVTGSRVLPSISLKLSAVSSSKAGCPKPGR
mmetsp:Transcript_103757/g.323413  ORF Transcript_103757/g.323413 Transcript_103757/m.323413 type:complete len:353 (+) Transcript_103757:196-1254(+)